MSNQCIFYTVIFLFVFCKVLGNKPIRLYDDVFQTEQKNDPSRVHEKVFGYLICLIDQDCVSSLSKCISNICMKHCNAKCTPHEYCNTTTRVCIPKLIRRRYSNECDLESHCLFNEACVNGKCVISNSFHFDCHTDVECGQHHICKNRFCEKKCIKNGNCENKTGDWCMSNNNCPIKEKCLHNQCRHTDEVILNKLCLDQSHCFYNEICKNKKCVKNDTTTYKIASLKKTLLSKVPKKSLKRTKTILPASFICDCDAKTENCDIKDCDQKPSKVESKPNKEKSSFNINDLKRIIRDLIREEENNLILEVTQNKQFTKERISITNRKNRFHNQSKLLRKIQNNIANDEDNRLRSDGIFGKNCFFNDDCKLENCCVMGVCMVNPNCSSDTTMKRESIKFYDLDNKNVNCMNNSECDISETCHERICISTSILKENKDESFLTHHNECTTENNCEELNHSCFMGVCVPSVVLSSNTSLCLANGECRNHHHSCWMNVCIP